MRQLKRETLNVVEAARMLGVSQPSLRRSAAAGLLPTVAVPGIRRLLFSRQRIEALVQGEGPEHHESAPERIGAISPLAADPVAKEDACAVA
jgi:excisionase family DNA binding protein